MLVRRIDGWLSLAVCWVQRSLHSIIIYLLGSLPDNGIYSEDRDRATVYHAFSEIHATNGDAEELLLSVAFFPPSSPSIIRLFSDEFDSDDQGSNVDCGRHHYYKCNCYSIHPSTRTTTSTIHPFRWQDAWGFCLYFFLLLLFLQQHTTTTITTTKALLSYQDIWMSNECQ